jgi:lipopolysaccharide export system permease protein
VIKKLDILIIRSFLGPFTATFFIALFVLIMQFFWLYIDDFVGKGIDFITLMKVIGVVAITWIPLALPLALLLSSIMTFGNLGETFEIVAIKSAGIPLLRFMRPLLVVTLFLSVVAFFLANNVIPFAQLKLARLKYDIIVANPAFDIKEGVFYKKIDGYVIKLGKKDKDDSTIHNIIIYERNFGLQNKLLIAESGIMRVTPDKHFLEFVMKNGCRYEEKGPTQTVNTEFIRLGFKEYKKMFDLRNFKMGNSEDSNFRYDPKMLSVRQLNVVIDSLESFDKIYAKRSKIEIDPYFNFAKFTDSNWTKIADTVKQTKAKSFAALVPDSLKQTVYSQSVNQTTSVGSNITLLTDDYNRKLESLRSHEIERHRKFTLSVACIVLFLIGAPLGSIIRKGGLGTPLVFAIIFFVLFHLLNTFGEKFARQNVTSVFEGMWLSTLVLIPAGFFLTYKAMRDSQLSNQEFYYRTFKQVRVFLSNFKKTEKEDSEL